jgi:hypothetical protein
MNIYFPCEGKDTFVWNAVLKNAGVPVFMLIVSRIIKEYVGEGSEVYTGVFNLAFLFFIAVGMVRISYPFNSAKRYLHHYEKFR